MVARALPISPRLETLLAKLGSRIQSLGLGRSSLESAEQAEMRAGLQGSVMPLDWPEVDALLPDGGVPRGAVVELAAPSALGGATSFAMATVRAAQARDARAWCAWLDPEGTLYGPGLARAGIDLARLLIVRAPREELARFAVKVAASCAFDVIVVDMDAHRSPAVTQRRSRARKPQDGRSPLPAGAGQHLAVERIVRKLAILAEEGGATILLLTDASAPRAVAWPVALRIELSRQTSSELTLRVAKERRGRLGLAKTIPFDGLRERDPPERVG